MPQSVTTAQPKSVPSPIATGGAGEDFERRLGAFALTLLLARGQAPVLLDAVVIEVHLQTRHLGWRTDDLLLVAEVSPGVSRKVAIQAKRSLTVSSSDQEFVDTITGMWDDFCDQQRFDPAFDRLAIATLHGTTTLLHHFNSLLACARASADGEDLRRRVAPGSYLSNKARTQHDTVWKIVSAHLGEEPDVDHFWRFLRVLTVLSYDLGTTSAQSESMALSLLSFIARDVADPSATAQATWAKLLDIASEGRQAAASYRRDQLPASLRDLHRAVTSAMERARRELIAHGRAVRDSIQSTISRSFAIDRSSLLDTLLTAVSEVPVTVIAGQAGSGKSALAKALLSHVEAERPVFAFQAVEFATPHLNETFARTQSGVTLGTLPAILAGHDRTTVFIDSTERLLEHGTRDAFTHLLQVIANTPAVRLVLACRDYSLDTVRSALLEPSGVGYKVIDVATLADFEIDAVAEAVPALARPLSEPRIRAFLRTPYLLEMASRLDWVGKPLPDSLRAFRERCWKELVRDESRRGSGMPTRREEAFIGVAHRRAAELRSFVRPVQSDPEALDALHAASLLHAAPETAGLYAPAHDVLEDWAILKWLDALTSDAEDPATALAKSVDGYPALRRGLRRWLSDRLDNDPVDACAFVLAASTRPELPSFFRDDCMVAALLSDSAHAFIDGCKARVNAGDKDLIRRLIHLLRVACKSPPTRNSDKPLPSDFLLPVGVAWEPMLELAGEHLPTKPDGDALLFLSLVEDWAKQVTITSETPRGASAAGRIASHLLPLFAGYAFDEARERTMRIILKIPRDATAFADLAERALRPGQDDRVASEFADLAVSTLSSPFVARDFPDIITGMLRSRLLMGETSLRAAFDSPSVGVDEAFGIHSRLRSDFFPASALQGPFYALLQQHPRKGVDFIVEMANHASTWYGERRWPGHDLEPANVIVVDVPGTGRLEQWENLRLYTLFRGMSVGPYALQSALMALEVWLLSIATIDGVDLESWLLHILRTGNSVLTTSVVASACIAHLSAAGRASLALLSSPELIRADRVRVAQEAAAASDVFSIRNPANRLYEDERRTANRLSHRREDLETLATRAQLTPLRDEVWAILDRHRSALSEDDEESRLWRLALHRMDVRGFRLANQQPDDALNASNGSRLVAVEPGGLEPDLQALVDESRERMASLTRHMQLRRAAEAAWESTDSNDIADWRRLLAEARSLADEEARTEPFARGGVGITAAIGIRNYLSLLEQDELAWCSSQVVQALRGDPTAGFDFGSEHARLFGPDRAAAAVLPLLVANEIDLLPADSIDLLAEVLTHSVLEIADYAFDGAGMFLGRDHDDLALRCAAAAVRVARLRESARAQRLAAEQQLFARNTAFAGGAGSQPDSHLEGNPQQAARAALAEDVDAATKAVTDIDLGSWEGRVAARRVFALLAYRTDLAIARDLAAKVADWLAGTWGRRRERRGQMSSDFGAELSLSEHLAGFALRLPPAVAMEVCAPIIALGPDEPQEVEKFVSDLVIAADKSPDKEARDSFWRLWQSFADSTADHLEGAQIHRDRPSEAPLIDRLFLGQPWKESVNHWRHLDGNVERVHALARRLPPAASFVRAYLRFLFTIGRQQLPAAFVHVDDLVHRGEVAQLMADADVSFYVETLLGQFVYGQPTRLKSERTVRDAVLRLLDGLVVAGSSAAYRMRDDFVTPHGVRDL